MADPRSGAARLPHDGVDDRRSALGPRSRRISRPPRVHRRGRRPGRVHRRQGRLESVADLSHRIRLRGAHRPAPDRTRRVPRWGVTPRPVRRHRGLGRGSLYRYRHPRPVHHATVSPPHLRPRDPRLGDLDVRGLCGLRAPTGPQRRDRGRRDPRREHGADRQRRTPVPGPVQPCRAPPAHPDACLRRAVRMGAPPARRPGLDLVRLPARRDRVHRRIGRRGHGADPDGRLGAAGRSVEWGRGQPAQPVAHGLAVPADRRLDAIDRSDLRREHPSRAAMEHGPGRRAHDRPESDGQGAVLLACRDLRQDRAERLEPDHDDDGRAPRRIVHLRPARRRRRT